MRRLSVIVLAGVAVVVLPGCALSTIGATSVTQTSAHLNASGFTGANTAYYHFEYARQRDQLGTAQGSRTPERGPIPPHVPANDTRIQFGETVTGLAPGHTYYDRVCGRPAEVPNDVCLGVDAFFTQPSDTQDFVTVDYGQDGKQAVSLQAASSASGADPDGIMRDEVLTSGDFVFSGAVTCLVVHGAQATIGMVGAGRPYTQPDQPDQPYTEVATLTAEQWRVNARTAGSTPPSCANGTFTGPYVSVPGAVVHDAP
jgi:predicted alpha/beta-hydrolase family hydrolase